QRPARSSRGRLHTRETTGRYITPDCQAERTRRPEHSAAAWGWPAPEGTAVPVRLRERAPRMALRLLHGWKYRPWQPRAPSRSETTPARYPRRQRQAALLVGARPWEPESLAFQKPPEWWRS